MIRSFFSFIGITIFCLLFGCYQDNKPVLPLEAISSIVVDNKQAKTYVADNVFLDVDVIELSKAINARPRRNIDTVAIGKIRAALYRYYSHVKVVDGKYTCDLKSAEEINLSERLFEALSTNLNDMNKWIDQIKSSGQEVAIQEINEEYLNALLE